MFGPDEPRYAFISRAMAQSGDWITPRLWGAPWFEKPALLYWMQAAAFRLGLPARPGAARCRWRCSRSRSWASTGGSCRREIGCRAAWMAALILGTSGLWVGYSQAGVTDIPLTAAYSAAMLLALPWVAKRDTPLAAGFQRDVRPGRAGQGTGAAAAGRAAGAGAARARLAAPARDPAVLCGGAALVRVVLPAQRVALHPRIVRSAYLFARDLERTDARPAVVVLFADPAGGAAAVDSPSGTWTRARQRCATGAACSCCCGRCACW